MNGALRCLLIVEFGAMLSFYSLTSSVPLYAVSHGATEAGAGLTTGVLMLATVLTDLAMPAFTKRFGHRTLFSAGLVLLGLPAFALSAIDGLPAILALSAIRGVGFAFVAVIGAALTAALAPRERRGETLGLYGAVGSVPAIVALPVGVWLVERIGYTPLFVTAAVCALAGVPLLRWLPRRASVAQASLGLARVVRAPAITRPAVLFTCVAMASGALITFLPFIVTRGATALAAIALLVQAAVSTITRWWSGRRGDRRGAPAQLWPGMVGAAAGLLLLAGSTHPVAVIVAMVLFGAGFGIAQDVSLTTMLNQVSSADFDTVSNLWNMAYDAGWGLGALTLGLIATQSGYSTALLLMGFVIVALAGALRVRASGLEPQGSVIADALAVVPVGR